MLRHWSQIVPNMSTDIRGHEAHHHHHYHHHTCRTALFQVHSASFSPMFFGTFAVGAISFRFLDESRWDNTPPRRVLIGLGVGQSVS